MLERIQKENDIKKLNSEELECLAGEIREFLVEKVSKTGGHLASNLGVVELTMALHLICDLPKDKIIWDVGHQSYTHKLLTGRKEGFEDLRSYGGMSGFPKRKESQCDAFDTGHSSTSISAGLGYVRARDLKHEDYTVISVIGDGSLTGGMAYEALNNASNLKTNFIVVLNDNHMSISENVGGMSRYLANLRTADIYTGLKKGVTNALQQVPVMGDRMIEHIRKTKSSIKQLMVPGMFFEDMGITYLGPIPGHNLPMLCKALKEAKKVEGPVLLHVMTTKGKGYEPAETAPDKFHGIGPFDIESGKVLAKKDGDTYTDVFGKELCDEASRNPDIVAITAAMADGTGLARFKKHYPNRFFDVGIAEANMIGIAAGLSAYGYKPIAFTFAPFATRRVCDQIAVSVAYAKQNVKIVGTDPGITAELNGGTHMSFEDVAVLRSIPNMIIYDAVDDIQLSQAIEQIMKLDTPVYIRMPRKSAQPVFDKNYKFHLFKADIIEEGTDVTIIATGIMVAEAKKAVELLKKDGINAELISANVIKPLDEKTILESIKKTKHVVTCENHNLIGGLYSAVAELVCQKYPLNIHGIGIQDRFGQVGKYNDLLKEYQMTPQDIYNIVKNNLNE